MLRFAETKSVCDDCPLRDGYELEPSHVVAVNIKLKRSISADGTFVSFLPADEEPDSERSIGVLMAKLDRRQLYAASGTFAIRSSQLESGELTEALDRCAGPVEVRSGLFNLRREMGCAAVEELRGS